jgi:SRSO17 transposase
MSEEEGTAEVLDPQRWGLPAEAVADLGDRLRRVWSRFRGCFRTRTRDPSEHAFVYLRGLLTLPGQRNYANIARRVNGLDDDGQDLQQFMSDSPWDAQAVFAQIQQEIIACPPLRGGMLTLDESGDPRAGAHAAGTARQYLGRLGKVDLGQVGVMLGYYHGGVWAMVDAQLYLPEIWFDADHTPWWKRWHIPPERTFLTKPQLGLQMIQRAKAQGLPFAVVSCDSLYGRDSQFRADLDGEDIIYMADIPADTHVYLTSPTVGIPPTPAGQKGRPFSRWRVLSQDNPVEVRSLVGHPQTVWQTVAVRPTERGQLRYPVAARPVWTITPQGQVRHEWLLLRREPDDTFSFSVSNAPADTPLSHLAVWRSQRYFAERTIQDTKSQAGWDELVARKYRAWVHHTALDALAVWFVAQTKLDWAQTHPPDPSLVDQLQLDVLPALSMANVREMLQAVLPLRHLSPEQATALVIKHLVNRSRSTRCRLKAQRCSRAP